MTAHFEDVPTHSQDKALVRVVAGVVEREGQILLARRRPEDSLGGYWEFPGGKIEKHESPEQALEREFKEEFGVPAVARGFIAAQAYDYGDRVIELLGYKAELGGEIASLRAHTEIAWVRREELHEYQLAPADEFLREILCHDKRG